MKTGSIDIAVFYLTCPYCDEQVSGDDGAFSLHNDNFKVRPGERVVCNGDGTTGCGRTFKMPSLGRKVT